MDTKSHQRSDRVYFHQIGIRGENNDLGRSKNWKMETFSGIRRMLDHVNKVCSREASVCEKSLANKAY